jgi:hypothetical protein
VNKNFTIRRTSSLVTITTPSLLHTVRTGAPITTITLAGAGAPPYTWGIVGGKLPAGLVLGSDGQITGIPTATGDFSFTVRLTDNTGSSTAATGSNLDKPFYLKVTGPMTITTATIPDGGVLTPYHAVLTASGGLPPYIWSGTLPAGLTWNGNTINGVPTTAGTTTLNLTVTDSDTPPRSVPHSYTLKVVNQLGVVENTLPGGTRGQAYSAIIRSQYGTPALQVIRPLTITIIPDMQITTVGLKGAITGNAYSDFVVVSGGSAPYHFETSGTVPTGLLLDPDTGVISGIPTLASGQSVSFNVLVTDSGTPSATISKQFTITGMDILAITTSTLPPATQKTAYTTTLSGSGGVGSYTWSIATGTLPTGLNLAATTGILSGTSAQCGSFPISVQLADSAPSPTTVQKPFTLAVACASSYDISGNGGGGGVTLNLTGSATTNTISAANGSFSFGSLLNGSYTVTPSKTGYKFTPASQVAIIDNQDVTLAPFTATDIVAPTVSSFSIPGTSATLNVAVTITTDDNVGVTGYYLSENGATPTATAAQWSSTLQTSFTFAARGPRTLYLWVKDAAGNISARSSAATTIEYQLTVTMSGSGGGSINSSPVGIAMTAGSKSATYAPATPVLLTQIPDATSFFSGWTGACINTSGHCTVSMTSDKSTTAIFSAAPKAMIGTATYTSLNAAYTAAVNGAVILALDTDLTENLIINKAVTIVGGHNLTYTGRTGQPTLLIGTVKIRGGKLTVDGITVR